MREYGTIIGGEQRPGAGWIEVRNPFSGEVVGRVAAADRATTLAVVERTRAAKIALSRHERHDLLNRIAARLESDASAASRLITDEAGLCLKDTRYEVARASNVLRFAAIQTLLDDSEVFPCDVSSPAGHAGSTRCASRWG